MDLQLHIFTFSMFAMPCMCTNFIRPFLTPNIKNIVYFEMNEVEDINYENYISISDQEKWMIYWNGSTIPEVIVGQKIKKKRPGQKNQFHIIFSK